ncbi:MAG: extracellular solute-binding protein [Clostridia bacterium]|nr:extracellular solute-binding protein [Clostridia bacterium]
MKKLPKFLCTVAAAGAVCFAALPLSACSKSGDEIVLRVSSWEEYIDLGGWKEDDVIELDGYDGILGVNSMVDDFTEWFNSGDHGFNVRVEYSTFGTNEDLYNRLNLGDTYDLVCPSDYLLMQLIKEGKTEKYSEEFRNSSVQDNFYTQNVSPFIDGVFTENDWDEYAACYMWGTTGIVYNPELVEVEDVSTWKILQNSDYTGKITIKDNVRDSYFPALGIVNRDTLISDDITPEQRETLLNDTSDEAIANGLQVLKEIKNNVYSFETDSGKADMITGKVVANYQWSGDAVFIMDEADGDTGNPTELWYSVPDECTNLWFDGWVMLKDGINGDERKQEAAEAFVNFLSRPDNAIRNMYYIGYTSAIAGDMVYEYLKWNYGAEDDGETELYEYDLSHLFGGERTLTVDASTLEIGEDGTISRGRQLFAQYPHASVLERKAIMRDFGDRLGAINQMWINVRCLDVKDFNPAVVWTVFGIVLGGAVAICLYKFRYQIFYREPKKKKAAVAV